MRKMDEIIMEVLSTLTGKLYSSSQISLLSREYLLAIFTVEWIFDEREIVEVGNMGSHMRLSRFNFISTTYLLCDFG